MKILIVFVYIVLVFITLLLLKRTQDNKTGFSAGILYGLLYFISIPLGIYLFFGEIYSAGISAEPFNIYNDTSTTFNIFTGWIVAILALLISSSLKQERTLPDSRILMAKTATTLKISVALYVVLSVYSVSVSGLWEGGHWHKTVGEMLSTKTSFVIIKNFSTALRVMIFGFIWASYKCNFFTRRKALLFASLLAVFDIALTMNRITFVFLIILIFVLFPNRRFITATIGCILLPFAATFSLVWPMFRGLAFSEHATLSSVSRAWNTSYNYQLMNSAGGIDEFLNSVFESSNLVVLNFVVKNAGGDVPYYWGSTFLLRPLLTFVPKTLYPNKPNSFGVDLGYIINGIDGLALNSTLFAEPIANFSVLWPAFLLGYILIMDRLYLFFSKKLPGLRYVGFFVAVSIWRFDSSFAVVCLYTSFLIYVTTKLVSILMDLKKRHTALTAVS